MIGRGSYGKVFVCQIRKEAASSSTTTHRTQWSQLVAVKVLDKENVRARRQVEHTRTERNVLEVICHPFIVKLHHAFQTKKKLYTVLEYCPGNYLSATVRL